MKDAPNCYECKFRGEVPGSAHSCCNHPSLLDLKEDPMMNVLSILGSVRGGLPQMTIKGAIKVVGNKYGMQRGWFNHPFNFDPTWLEECDGFEQK